MADTTVTIKQDGTEDYTTISSAVAASNVSSGFYKMVIDDSQVYNENVTLEAATGTTTSSNYLWLTVSSGNRHSGVVLSSTPGNYARLNGSASHGCWLKDDYTRVEYLALSINNQYSMVNMSGDETVISRCLVHGFGITNTGDGIYVQGSGNRYIDNTLVNVFRQGVYIQCGYSSSDPALTVYLDSCTLVDNDGDSASYNLASLNNTSNTLTMNLHNCALGQTATRPDMFSSTSNPGGGSKVLAGSHNVWDTDTSELSGVTNNLTNNQDISSGGVTETTTTANAMIVTDNSTWPYNFTPVVATGSGSNLLLTNGTNRRGSEPDSRQDFSTDIRGTTRPTATGYIDIGAFQITVAPASFKYWNGSAFVAATAVQYWNGSAWTDVTGIQYWNGSAWTDVS